MSESKQDDLREAVKAIIYGEPTPLGGASKTDAILALIAQAAEQATERAAQYHDKIADAAQAEWERARKRGIEFANRGNDVAAHHRVYAKAIRTQHKEPS